MNARYQAFDTAEHLALSADTAWEAVKDRGNAALKEGNHLGASRLYRDAGQLALGPLKGGMIHAFIETLESFPDGSAQRRLAATSDILWDNLIDTLPTPPLDRKIEVPGDEAMSAEHPNKGAGIAFANRAQALLAAGKPKTALKSARRATAANPSYVKAHYREMKALEVLGLQEEAAEIREEIENFGKLRAMRMQEALALVAVGWIDWHRWVTLTPTLTLTLTLPTPLRPAPRLLTPHPHPTPTPNPSPNPNQREDDLPAHPLPPRGGGAGGADARRGEAHRGARVGRAVPGRAGSHAERRARDRPGEDRLPRLLYGRPRARRDG